MKKLLCTKKFPRRFFFLNPGPWFFTISSYVSSIVHAQPDLVIYSCNISIDILYQNRFLGQHNIALAKLSRPLTWSSYVRPINLPRQNSEPRGNASMVGWGSISTKNYRRHDPVIPNNLQTANVEIMQKQRCKLEYARLIDPTALCWVHDTNICTNPGDDHTEACWVSIFSLIICSKKMSAAYALKNDCTCRALFHQHVY